MLRDCCHRGVVSQDVTSRRAVLSSANGRRTLSRLRLSMCQWRHLQGGSRRFVADPWVQGEPHEVRVMDRKLYTHTADLELMGITTDTVGVIRILHFKSL